MPKAREEMVRISISMPRAQHRMLARIAESKKVSLAWVVRDANEKYIESLWPLFAHDLETGEGLSQGTEEEFN